MLKVLWNSVRLRYEHFLWSLPQWKVHYSNASLLSIEVLLVPGYIRLLWLSVYSQFCSSEWNTFPGNILFWSDV